MSYDEQEGVFRHGVDGYFGGLDTQLLNTRPDRSYGEADLLAVDGKPESQVLLAFQELFGDAPGQVPFGAEITNATLVLQVTNGGHGASIHRLLRPWSDADTWNTLDDGIQADGTEAAVEPDLVTNRIEAGTLELDVTSSVQAWASGAPNYGWAFLSLGTNGWYFHSSTGEHAPKLVVRYTVGGAETPENDSENSSAAWFLPDDDPEDDTDAAVMLTSSSTQKTVTFQQGAAGYSGTVDTQLSQAKPTTSFATTSTLKVDSDEPNKSGFDQQALLHFFQLFGSGPGQIPPGAVIVAATLTLNSTGKGDGAALHRMLVNWKDTDTWSSMTNGIQADGTEAVATPDLITGKQAKGTSTLDVTNSVQAWSDGAPNHGWAFLSQGPDGWKFHSSEGSVAPKLSVTYYVPSDGGNSSGPGDGDPQNSPPVAQNDAASSTGAAITIDVLANDHDPDGDPLSVSSVTDPGNGTAQINANNTITYVPASGFVGTDTFGYTITDGQGHFASATVTVTVTATSISASYIATTLNSNDERNMEHTNASKSFYHDGSWWAVLPNDKNWYVHRFDGALPEVGTLGGWTVASSALAASKMRADIAWDPVNEKLYVLQFRLKKDPVLYKLGYETSTDSWKVEASIKVAGTGGVLSGAHWIGNDEIAIGIDQKGNPLLTVMGPSPAGGENGLHFAYATTSNLKAWSEVNLDNTTSAMGGSNGNAKADFVTFTQGGVEKIGLVYSADGNNKAWKIVWHDAVTNPSDYKSGWSSEVVTNKVGIDDHISVVTDGTTIFAVVKDNNDSIWLFKGTPGNWEDPIKVHNGTKDSPKFNPSRPTIVLDEDNGQLYVFYQETVSKPRGEIYMKTASIANPVFDPKDPGTKILTSGESSPNMIDPQGPVHNVGAQTDGYFFLFAKNADAPEVWYNDILLTSDYLLA